jgi:predicted transcriptional regulator
MMKFEQDEKNIENSSSRNRGRTQIMADILDQCKENKRKSHVMQKANLNFDQVSLYLRDLLGRGFVEQGLSEGGKIYRTTDKGREFLDRYQKLIGFFRRDRSSRQSKNDRANVSPLKPIQHTIRSKTLTISFLLTISLGMTISQSMPTLMTTTAILSLEQQFAYAQEDNAVGDKLESEEVDTGEKKETSNIDNDEEKESGDNDSGTGDDTNGNENDSQLDAGDQEKDGEEGSGVTVTPNESEESAALRNSSVENPKQVVGDRELPDDDCLFDPSLPKCAPVDGECPDGFAMNEAGQCYPDKPCPKGYERRDNDETGTCYSVSEKHLKVIVQVKGANGAGKVSVEAKEGAGDSRFVDNIQGSHVFKFYKNSIPVGAELKACVYSDKLDKELCKDGKNGPESEPEKMTIAFSSDKGLKVIVNVKGADGAGKVLVKSEETDNILSRTVDNIKGKHTFQFKTGEVPIGGKFEACVHSDKLGKELCMEGKNGPESEPEQVGVTFQEGLKVIVHFARSDNACVRTVDDSHRAGCKAGNPGDEVVFQFGTGDVEIGEEVYACFQGYDDDCRSAINGPESAPEHIYQLR